MKCQILDYSVPSNTGIISSPDGKLYHFTISEWKGSGVPMRGITVDFKIEDNQAKSVYGVDSTGYFP